MSKQESDLEILKGVSSRLVKALEAFEISPAQIEDKARLYAQENSDRTWVIFQVGGWIRKQLEGDLGHDAAMTLTTKLKDEMLAAMQAAETEG